MSWRRAAAIGLVMAAGACGGATTTSHGGPADSGADEQAPEASTDGHAGVPDAGPEATPLCGGATCAANELCHWNYATCGRPAVTPGNGELYPGSCLARDATCDAQRPVCGCDGQTYASECAAHATGVDLQWDGCTAPPGYFQCGAKFCRLTTEVCRKDLGDTGDQWSHCEPLPACDAGTLCDCLDATICDPSQIPDCSDDGQGRATESCSY